MRIGIIGAMTSEIEKIKSTMELKETKTIAKSEYYVGTYEQNEIILTCCGIGKVNSSSKTQIMIDTFKPDYIINSGIAGSLSKQLKILDTVVVNECVYHDMDKNILKNNYPFASEFFADNKLVKLASETCEELNTSFKIGKIITGDQFISDTQIKNKLIEVHSPLCVDMESTAIAHVCSLNDIPFVILRSISDEADDDGEMNFDIFEKKAADISSHIVLNMVKKSI